MKKKIQPRVWKVTREIFNEGDFIMLQLIATRLHNDMKALNVDASFMTSGNSHTGNRLEVEMVENPGLLKFLIRSATSYRNQLKPFFAKAK